MKEFVSLGGFGDAWVPGTPSARLLLSTDGEGLVRHLNERDRWAVEMQRRRDRRPRGTAQWMLDLGDDEYAAEMKRRSDGG